MEIIIFFFNLINIQTLYKNFGLNQTLKYNFVIDQILYSYTIILPPSIKAGGGRTGLKVSLYKNRKGTSFTTYLFHYDVLGVIDI